MIIILSEPSTQADYLFVPINSLHSHHKEKVNFFTCHIYKHELPNILSVDSTLNYIYCNNASIDHLEQYKNKGFIGTKLLKKCQDGAKKSIAFKPFYHKYFDDF